jgi:hypothetical protein
MISKRPSDLFGDGDLPTTGEDVQAQRAHRPSADSDWLDQLATLAAQVPQAGMALRQRRTFAAFPPFEL